MFPWHNDSWRETAEFLAPRALAGERILAPDVFRAIVPRVERYVPANLVPERAYDWVVLATRDMPQIPRSFLEHVAADMGPVFANRAFVIWTAGGGASRAPSCARSWGGSGHDWAGSGPSRPSRTEYAANRALGDAPSIVRHTDISDAELRAGMNEFHRTTGYQYPTRPRPGVPAGRATPRPRLSASAARGGRVLELASGGERFMDVPDQVFLVRTELSEVAVGRARDADGSRSEMVHVVMDAHQIAFPGATFDAVLFVDAIEHVRDAASVFRAAAAVLAPGGELLVTFANRNSVHLVLTEKLGYPEFATNHQHIREFTLGEIRELLDDAGLEIIGTSGITLYPYWGVPGVDQAVRRITDDDPEFVELMRELGRRVGAEHAYTGVVSARKPADAAAGSLSRGSTDRYGTGRGRRRERSCWWCRSRPRPPATGSPCAPACSSTR